MANEKEPTYGHGKICYIEMPAIDISVSAAFYEKVFGWKVRTRGDGSVAFDDSVTEVSGTWVTGRKPFSGDGLTIHIMVFDMDATLAAVKVNGGKIIETAAKDLPHSVILQEMYSDYTSTVIEHMLVCSHISP